MSRFRKIALLVLAVALLFGSSRVQNILNRDRDTLGLTRVQPLDNAPPVLAFTTVALGGFRGLISNMLWIRANDLQEEDKFFEMAQLADWITKLEPHFSTVWTHQAWNMAYNISVKFKQSAPGEYPDRWRWVKRGFELLRDEGLKYNPNDVAIHQQLAWIFQHKLGANLDDANMYYKREWMREMAKMLGTNLNNGGLDELINPQTPEAQERARLLKEKYKMDPVLMKRLDEEYGPLEWRLPEAHAIYWAAEGLEKAKANPTKVNLDDLAQLRRVIFQSMLLSFQRGKLIINPFTGDLDLGPNLDIIPNTSKAYEKMMADDPKMADSFQKGHRSFLRQAVYSLYVNNRVADAAKWFKYLGEKYPNLPVVDGDPTSFPRNLTLEEYAVSSIQIDINETSRDRVKTAIQGFIVQMFSNMIVGDQDRAANFRLLANAVWKRYRDKIPNDRWPALEIPTVDNLAKAIRDQMLDPEQGLAPEARAILRTQLNMPAETVPASTNAVNSASPAASAK